MTAAAGTVRIRVPATSANLGPGFDALGLALDLHDEIVVSQLPGCALEIGIEGIGSQTLPRDERHLLVATLRTAARRFDLALGGLALRASNAIPQGRGLGSSAATIVAGVAAAMALARPGTPLDREVLVRLAAELEGHPDNVAACVLGGLTIAWQGHAGVGAVSMEVHPDICPVLLVPPAALDTRTARGLLPASVPHVDAAFTAGRSALLVHALTSAPHLLMTATEDRLHQQYRAAAMPDSARLLESLRAAGIPAVISGAGPSVLAFAASTRDPRARVPPGWTAPPLAVGTGVEVWSDLRSGE